ncbi:MAG: hypothetical protein V1763_03210 [Parcubacteria group bacterium]
MKKHPEVFLGFVLFGLVCLLASCDGRGGQGDRAGVQSGNVDAVNLPASTADLSGWTSYIDRQRHFLLPRSWHFLVQDNDASSPDLPTWSVLIKDTDKPVVLGGAAPDWYYSADDHGRTIPNDGMYPIRFIAVQVEAYDGWQGKDWSDFFQAAYPSVVRAFAPIDLPFANAPEAVMAVEVAGIWRGEPRLLVRRGGKIYDCALFAPGTDRTVATQIFSAFLANFDY